jgi:hypothetical protein
MLNARDLTLLASEQFTTDLELVLAERLAELADVDAHLEAAKAVIEDLEAEIEEITSSREYWRSEAIEAQFQLAESVDDE